MSASTATLQGILNALAGLQRTAKLTLILALAVMPGPTSAAPPAAVHNCDHLESIANLMGHVRDFANGAIRIAHVSIETRASPIFVSLDAGGDECFAISASSDDSGYSGFYSLSMAKVRASYDAQKGLLLRVPVSVYDYDKGCGGKPAEDIKVRVNRKNVSVTIEK
jgi:hypothetical protein